MESAIIFLVIIFLLILILPIILSWRTYQQTKKLRDELLDLRIDLQRFIKKQTSSAEPVSEKQSVPVAEPQTAIPSEPIIIPPVHETKLPDANAEPIIIPPVHETKIPDANTEPISVTPPLVAPTETTTPKELHKPIQWFNFKWPSFNNNKNNIEQFIGEKLISIIGIAILVLGVFFTVKWAVDKNLISDATKVLIGFGAGALLVALAHKLSKNYRAFSSILAGGAIAIFYFAVYQSFQAYHLLPQTAAFVAMIFITLFAVVLSVLYNKVELAMIALIGGFLTPFFVSTGEGNFIILFTYMLILNIGMFSLAYFKKWPILHFTAYILTVFIFGFWLYNSFNPALNQQKPALLFATLFHLTFLATALVYNIRKNERFHVSEISLLLSNAMAYLVAGLYIYNHINHGVWNGLFVLGLATLYLGIVFILYRKQNIDKNVLYLLLALVCTFISLAGPIQLDGNSITLFWAAEGVLLLYIGQKANIPMLKQASALVVVLTLISLGMDWKNNYYAVRVYRMSPVFNQAFLTTLVVGIGYFTQHVLLRKENNTAWFWNKLPLTLWQKILLVLLAAVIFLGVYFEVGYQGWVSSGLEEFRNVMQGAWVYLFLALSIYILLQKQQRQLSVAGGLVLLFAFLSYLVFETFIKALCHRHLGGVLASSFYYLHVLLPIMALLVVVVLVRNTLKPEQKNTTAFKWVSWGATIATLYILSAESIHLWVHNAYERGFAWEDSERKAIKTAWPIIWSICSLLLMMAGMRQRIKLWRIISLSLFTLTIAKLFMYDISNVGQGGKIAAFIILGIILLLVSFLYQKIKGLFTDDDDTLSTPNA